MKIPIPPIGQYKEVTQGIFHSGGNINDTVDFWKKENQDIIIMDADGIDITNISKKDKIGIILSDDSPFDDEEKKQFVDLQRVSLGKKWLQGHSCIAITQYEFDKL